MRILGRRTWRRGPPRPVASSSPASPLPVPALGTQPPPLQRRHAAAQLFDGRAQRLLNSHHRVHDAPGTKQSHYSLCDGWWSGAERFSPSLMMCRCDGEEAGHAFCHIRQEAITQAGTCRGQGRQTDKAQTH